jgi:lipid-binding SYLF domain-containing protein
MEDAQLRAQILSWSRSRGAFSGISLEGVTLREDEDANSSLYGKAARPEMILRGKVAISSTAKEFTSTLGRYSHD